MSYLVLARKYRPQTFDEVYAQNHITEILKNTIELDRTAHAYLFTGPRGVGKTSLARIFSKSLNCLENGPTTTPCNKCENCKDITQGISSDVIEIDGASNTGIDDIRELQKELMYSPSNSNYKIYIIDEVHMLSKNAFNALLKTLEEPPKNVIFIFATTEPHKVIPTIISRCQRFDFKRIPVKSIIARLQDICKKETIEADEEALFLIAKKADGSMRDAQSLMDQIMAYGKDRITHSDVLSIFGIVPDDIFHNILDNIANKETSKIIKHLHSVLEKGNDIQEFLNGLLDYIRNLMLLKIGIDISVMSKIKKKSLVTLSTNFTENDLLYLTQLLIKLKMDIKNSNNPILVTEMAFVKIAKLAELQSIDKLINAFQDGSINIQSEIPKEITLPTIKPEILQNTIQSREDISEKNNLKEKQRQPKEKINLTIQMWENDKELIIKKLKIEKMILGNFLNNCDVDDILNNVIHFIVGKKLAFEMLTKEKNLVAKIISNYFNTQIRVDFKFIKNDKDTPNLNPTIEDIKKELPQLAKFIEKTDSIIN